MNGLLEFVFEDVASDEFARLIADFVDCEQNLINATEVGVDLPLARVFDPTYWHELWVASKDTACFLNLRTLKIGDVLVKNPSLYVIFYNGKTDVSVLVSSDDCRPGCIDDSTMLYQWAKLLSEEYHVENFYGGLEPASDAVTQIFSKAVGGPVCS